MDYKKAIAGLRQLVGGVVVSGIRDSKSFRDWKKEYAAFVADCLGYERHEGMPEAKDLVGMQFHPELPLVILNYTQVAHNTLHAYPDGWTPAIRLCRGIVFDRDGVLVALPFEKFFNYGEHPETLVPPDGDMEATDKHDGHLGIVFRYDGRFLITTRGTFTHRSSALGQEMLDKVSAERNWKSNYPDGLTLLTEIIHPETEVHLDYSGATMLIAIGARHVETLEDYRHGRLQSLAAPLGLTCTNVWSFRTPQELRDHVADDSVRDREGFVARFPDGRRVKFKFRGYLGLMFAAKLSYRYVMQRLMFDDLDDRLGMMEPTDRRAARAMVKRLMAVRELESLKEKRALLYGLLRRSKKYGAGGDTPYNRGICNKFIKFLDGSE